MQQRDRFATLDAFRGLAAIMVYLYHAGVMAPLRSPGGYLAVDLFFALSGFVLAYAYEDRLRAGFSPGRFMALRLARLYPVYFATTLIFLGGLGQLLMIPSIAPGTAMYAPNVPMWSLALELVANLVYALFVFRLGWRGLAGLLAASGLLLGYGALVAKGSVDFGGDFADAPWELVRTLFSFTVGVMLCRLRNLRQVKRIDSRLGWLLLALLPLPLLYDPASRGWWDLACVFVLFPALIWFGANWDLPRSRIAQALGDLSYPFYCIHFPLLILGVQQGVDLTVLLAALVATAWAIDRWYDRPARAWLAGLVKRKPLRTTAAPI